VNVFVVVNYVVFVLPNYVHCIQHVKRVVHPTLYIFKIHLLADLKSKKQVDLTSQNFLYISRISFAICVPVTMGRSRTFLRTDLLRKTSFLSFLSFPSSLLAVLDLGVGFLLVAFKFWYFLSYCWCWFII